MTSPAAAQVDAAIDGEAPAAALVTPVNAGGNNGTGVVAAMEPTSLAGGINGYIYLFTVTGTVLIRYFGRCTGSVVGASATIKSDIALSNASLIASHHSHRYDENEIRHDASPDASIEPSTVLTEKIVNQDIRQTVETADITAGELTYFCIWKPLTPGSSVVAAA